MAASPSARTKAFISYSHKDRKFLDELEEHLSYFERQGLISYWDDKKLAPGDPWEDEINKGINAAKVAIFLVSRSFLASDFISRKELPPLLEAAQNEGTLLLSVIVRPCLFRHTVLAKFQAVNDTSKPLSELNPSERDRVWVKLAELVSKTLTEQKLGDKPQPSVSTTSTARPEPSTNAASSPTKTVEQLLDEAMQHRRAERYQAALTSYEQALELDPDNATAAFGKGNMLWNLNHPRKARDAYKVAFQLAPKDSAVYINDKGIALLHLKREEEALAEFEHAIQLDPNYVLAYHNKGVVLYNLKRYEEALAADERAIQLDPTYVFAHNNKGYFLYILKRYEEALTAAERTIQLDPNFPNAWQIKGHALKSLGKEAESTQAYEKAEELRRKA